MKEVIHDFFSSKRNVIIILIINTIVLIALTCVIITNSIMLNKKICTIQFDVDGGSFISSQEVECNTETTKPANPEKKGFKFVEWYHNNKIFDFNTKIDSDIILKAKWENDGTKDIVKITFNSNGGSVVSPIEVAKGEISTAPIDPTKKGYVFLGWYLNDKKYDFKIPVKNDIELTAKWEEEIISVTNVEIKSNTNECVEGETIELKVVFTPTNVKNKNGRWQSSNLQVAAGDNTGKITCKSPGTSTITFTSFEGNKKDSINITVKEKEKTPEPITQSIKLSSESETLKVGENKKITYTILPEGTIEGLTWTSQNSEVASISSDGLITAISPGTTTITIKNDTISATCNVTVTSIEEENISE